MKQKGETYKFMDGQKVCLGQRIFYLENFREIVNGPVCTLKSKAGLFLKPLCRINANRNTLSLVFPLSEGFNVVKVTNCPGQKLMKSVSLYLFQGNYIRT